jgi:beta-glucosidase
MSAAARGRVKGILQRMTLEEKVAQLGSVWGRDLLENGRFSRRRAEDLLGRGIGQITRMSGGSPEVKSPKVAAEIVNDIQRFLTEETRLGVPAMVHEECLSGFMARGATSFPQAIGLASTWDPELMRGITSTIGRQMRAVGAHQGLSPVLDIARDPRWGRTEETLGEDPYLVARMGAAYIEGLQGEDYSSGVIATPKHFAAHGFPEGGRNRAPVHVPPRELREVFLLPFEAAVREAGARSLMNAYHEIDGVPCAASHELLTSVLRGEWGFRGFVVSDYGSVRMLMTSHRVAADEAEAAVQALEAGIDVELPRADCYGQPLLRAADEGRVSESTIDLAVSRVLTAKLLLGLFENPYVDAEAATKVFDTAEDRALALEAARKSIVLLKNDGLLPLSKDLGSIAVVGPNADSTRNLLGDYSYTAHLRCDVDAVPVVSVLKGIERKVSKQTKVYHARGCEVIGDSTEGFTEALEAAKRSDVVVAVVGERSGLSPSDVSGEHRDRSDLGLPGVQEELVRALHETGKPTVVVLVNGRPLSVGWIAENCSAIIETWLPGEEGGSAVADVLFGDHNPGGRLPISFPRSVGQIPVNYNRKPSSFGDYVSLGSKPLFPFGHGLSYTVFEYGSLTIAPEMVPTAGKVAVSCEIGNAGDRRGDEVVQLYVNDDVASVSRPAMELKGFKRVGLEPGEKKRVTFVLSMDQLAFYDRHMRLVVEPGTFRVSVGSSSEDIRLTGGFEVIGGVKVTPNNRKLFTEISVQ